VPDLFLLDTSAFIALTDREPGVERVRELLKKAKRREISLYSCFVSLTEVHYIKTYDAWQRRNLIQARSVYTVRHGGSVMEPPPV
jgi:predicted nucleic acid-binding protein